MTVQLTYIARPNGWGQWDWLEVCVIYSQPAGDPAVPSVGNPLAAFKFTADALRYALAQITPHEAAANLLFDGAGELTAIISDVGGKISYETILKGRFVVPVAPGHTDGRSLWGVVVRPCQAPADFRAEIDEAASLLRDIRPHFPAKHLRGDLQDLVDQIEKFLERHPPAV